MKTIFAILLTLMFVGTGDSYAQGQTYAVVGAGASFEGTGTFSMFLGGDIPIYTDTSRGFSSFTRAAYHFSDRDEGEEDQGIAIWQMIKRDITSWANVAIGGGLTYNLKAEDDEQAAGVKVEFSFTALPVAIILGGEYLPDAGENGNDVRFVYGGVNLMP